MKYLLTIILLIPVGFFAQISELESKQIDSLKQVIRSAQHDSIIVQAWMDWDNIIYVSDPELDIELNSNINELCSKNLKTTLHQTEKLFFLRYQAFALNNLGLINKSQGNYSEAVDNYTKSLKIRTELSDKNGMAASYNNLGNIHADQGNYTDAFNYLNLSLEINKEIDNKKGMASALNNIGFIHQDQGNYKQAIDYYSQSLEIEELIDDQLGIAQSLNNIGIIFQEQGNHATAIDYYTRCLKIYDKIGDKNGKASTLGNIGNIYSYQNNFTKAIEFYSSSMKAFEEVGNLHGMASSLNNIGNIYAEQNENMKALDFFERSLKIEKDLGYQHGIAESLNNIGGIYNEQNDLNTAFDYYNESLEIYEGLDDKKGIAAANNNIGNIFHRKGDYNKAVEYCTKALEKSKEVGAFIEIKNAAHALYVGYKSQNLHNQALDMYELYIETRDSIESDENHKEVIRQEYKYKYEKEAASDSIQNAEAQKIKDAQLLAEKAQNRQHELEAAQQQQQAYFLYGILGLALLFGGFISNRFRVTKKQKNTIKQQKEQVDIAFEELEEKNTEIMDSIKYAKRIQSAILPPNKIVKEYLKESFILYKPKDIVAGDFYWMETVSNVTANEMKQSHTNDEIASDSSNPRNDVILFAAADCTGHGVPGALVSVVCNNGLNRSVREFGLTDPGKILDKTREIVIQEFEKSEEEVKDGMDIALCSLDGNILQYAGAHNPLWILRNGEVLETKANKQPIGKFDKQTPYTTHTFELKKGDTIYIFTDGYADQFGGAKNKKFKSKALKNLFLSIQEKDMDDQKIIINDTFEKWKNNIEQIDDVCIIAVRV